MQDLNQLATPHLLRDFGIVFAITAANGVLSLGAVWLFLRGVEWVRRHVFRAVRVVLFYPMAFVLLAIETASLWIFDSADTYLFGRHLRNDSQLNCLVLVFIVTAAVPSIIYFYRNKQLLKDAGYFSRHA